LSRFGPTPGLWTVYTHIYTYTYIHVRRYMADTLARSYAHTPTAKPYFIHAVRTLRAIYRTSIPDTITRPALLDACRYSL